MTGDRLQLTRIRELLAARGHVVDPATGRRRAVWGLIIVLAYSRHSFVADPFILKRNWRRRSQTTVRMEDTAPGEVAEMDFGRLGMIVDGAPQRRAAGGRCGG